MNYVELQDAALGTSFRPDVYRAAAKRFVNYALTRLIREVNLPTQEATATVTTVAEQADYDLPTDYLRLRGTAPLTIGTDRLEEADADWLALQEDATGTPRYFTLTENLVRFYPTPTGGDVVTMRYDAGAPALVDDADEPAIPEHMHEALVFYAKSRLFAEEDDAQMAAYWLGMWTDAIRAFRNERGRSSAPRQVSGTWGFVDMEPSTVRFP